MNKAPIGSCVVPKPRSKSNPKSSRFESVVPKFGKSGEVVGNKLKSPGKSLKLRSSNVAYYRFSKIADFLIMHL